MAGIAARRSATLTPDPLITPDPDRHPIRCDKERPTRLMRHGPAGQPSRSRRSSRVPAHGDVRVKWAHVPLTWHHPPAGGKPKGRSRAGSAYNSGSRCAELLTLPEYARQPNLPVCGRHEAEQRPHSAIEHVFARWLGQDSTSTSGLGAASASAWVATTFATQYLERRQYQHAQKLLSCRHHDDNITLTG